MLSILQVLLDDEARVTIQYNVYTVLAGIYCAADGIEPVPLCVFSSISHDIMCCTYVHDIVT